MATYDLTPRIAPNLDRHLVFPLLEFLQESQLYPDEQILKAKIELLNKTNMVDYAMDIHKSLYRTEEVPQGKRRKTHIKNMIFRTRACRYSELPGVWWIKLLRFIESLLFLVVFFFLR